ncbi:MAG TPA: hypothetical protein DCM87_12040, partial [Planctomycetes bacterium]|nr:hypothetical protein [Planctomycetota bacterium]
MLPAVSHRAPASTAGPGSTRRSMKTSIRPEIWQRAQRGHLQTWVDYARDGMARAGTRAAAWRAILDAAAREAPFRPGERILDIGCGLDTVLDFIPDARGFTLDSLAAALIPLGLSPAARHTAGVFEAMPFASGAFDRVFLMNVLDHVRDPAAGLGEIARVLAPEG